MKWLFLLRGFFPSWRFFDEIGPQLALQVRYRSVDSDWSQWTGALSPIARQFKSFPLNPQAALMHACQNSLDHFFLDLNDGHVASEDLLSYKIIKRIAFVRSCEISGRDDLAGFQFKIVQEFGSEPEQEILASPEYRT